MGHQLVTTGTMEIVGILINGWNYFMTFLVNESKSILQLHGSVTPNEFPGKVVLGLNNNFSGFIQKTIL